MRRTLVIALVVAVLLVLGFIYYALDPTASAVFPRCTFLSLTGYKCPGCGSQRAIHALLHGDVVSAFRYNALLLVAIPWIALCLYAEGQRTRNPACMRVLMPRYSFGFFLPCSCCGGSCATSSTGNPT